MRLLAIALILAAAAPSPAPEDDGYLVPPGAGTEEPIVVGNPLAEPTPRVFTRDSVVDRPIAYQNVAFGSAPETVSAQLGRFKLARLEPNSQGLAYGGSGDFLGAPTDLAALFTPSSRRLFSLTFTTALARQEPWRQNLDRYRTRKRLLVEKYGLPTREMESTTAAEAVWRFVDGELQCTLDSHAVRVVYVHEPGLRLMRDEQEAMRQQLESRLKEDL